MVLNGEKVTHSSFGNGVIVDYKNDHITVLFEKSNSKKTFNYPFAFGAFLELDDKSMMKQIEEDKITINQRKEEEKQVNIEKSMQKLKAIPKENTTGLKRNSAPKETDRNNIAFKCNYCDGGSSAYNIGFMGVCSDALIKYNINTAKHIWCSQKDSICYRYLHGEMTNEDVLDFYESTKSEFSKSICYESQMLEIWTAGAGITQNGDDKGKPMSFRNVKSNSLALLTTKLPGNDDDQRFIFAVFLINESYEGDNREEGFVRANPKYKIKLTLEEAKNLKFWDYYFNINKPERIVFGSGLHRYFSDEQSAQVLKKICDIKKGTLEEDLAKDFLEHYCKLKELDVDHIPIRQGALYRGTNGGNGVA